ncbi:MAG: Asp23/Gls24 family envelope stress response protein [Syntrophomonadaceae bacterium]|nr:Asp23/Gls24 family envelope stress response protein [Syntrophomonadaceae bacterium]
MDTGVSVEKISSNTDIGAIRIAEEVVSTIAGLAAVEVEGVAAMSGSLTSGLTEILGRKNLSKGVKVEVGETEASIDAFIVVEYGFPIPVVAKAVQTQVKSAVETMTGLNVTAVNIHVVGVSMKKSKAEEESSEK